MKQGKTLSELAAELDRQSHNKLDVVVDTREIGFRAQDNVIEIPQHGEREITEIAHRQIAQRTGIPARYYDRMRTDAPQLLNDNVRQWFDNEPERRMVRTLDGNARAFLSDRYRIIDNDEIMYTALQSFQDQGMQVLSSDVTDSHMYLQARWPKLEGEVKKNDIVQMGIVLRNSEVGMGAVSVVPMLYRLVCTNGMVSGFQASNGRLRAAHLGRQQQVSDDHIVFADDTREANDRALMLKIRDTIQQLSDPALFIQLVRQMQAAADTPAVQNPIAAVEVVSKQYNINDGEKAKVLENLIRDQDYTLWGMSNAVTRLGNEVENYNRAIELEELGGQILAQNLGAKWRTIAEAA